MSESFSSVTMTVRNIATDLLAAVMVPKDWHTYGTLFDYFRICYAHNLEFRYVYHFSVEFNIVQRKLLPEYFPVSCYDTHITVNKSLSSGTM